MTAQKMIVFTPTETASHNCRLPCLVATPQGALLAFCEARQGGGGDWDLADIFVKRSIDGGATWGAPRKIVDRHAYGEGNAGNISAIPDRLTGQTHILFCFRYRRFFRMATHDGGVTFSEPVEITPNFASLHAPYPWTVLALGPGHGIQLGSGRLVIGAWASTGEGQEQGANLGHRPSESFVVFSDDHGKTWQAGAAAARTTQDVFNPSECIPAELPDGSLLLGIRTESNARRRLWALSKDGGRRWDRSWFDAALPEPVCASSLLCPRGTENALVYVGLDSRPDHGKRAGTWREAWEANMAERKNLALWISRDLGEHWSSPVALDAGRAAYVDACESPGGRSMLFLYESANELALLTYPTPGA